jgi:predicted phosphoadenosine phosphosulfate sulfurtransferase
MTEWNEIYDLFEELDKERKELFANQPKHQCQYCGSLFYHPLEENKPCIKCLSILGNSPIAMMNLDHLYAYKQVLLKTNRCDIATEIKLVDMEIQRRTI